VGAFFKSEEKPVFTGFFFAVKARKERFLMMKKYCLVDGDCANKPPLRGMSPNSGD
jgi:hypothetical protein